MATKTAKTAATGRTGTADSNLSLRESFGSRGPGIKPNREAGIIPGVKIVGFESKNRRRYLPEALRGAIALYEGAPVYVNHPKNPTEERPYQDHFGTLQNVRMTESGLYGDLKYKTKHPMAETVLEDAENDTKGIGLSPNHFGSGKVQNGIRIVESISRVESVDIVANPATNISFRESETPNVDLTEQLTEATTRVAELTAKVTQLTEQAAALTAENAAMKEAAAKEAHKSKVAGWLKEHKIPAVAQTPEFIALCESVDGETAEKAIKSLAGKLGEVKVVAASGTPGRGVGRMTEGAGGGSGGKSGSGTGDGSGVTVTDGKSFARAITG